MNRWLKFLLMVLVGLGIGMTYGWVINPVEYKDTSPPSLRMDFRTDYVLMVAEVFSSSGDINTALKELAVLGSQLPLTMVIESIAYANQVGYSIQDLVLFQDLATGLQVQQTGSGGINP